MRKRKSKHKENQQINITNSKYLMISKERKDRLVEIIELLRLKHLRTEKESIKFVTMRVTFFFLYNKLL